MARSTSSVLPVHEAEYWTTERRELAEWFRERAPSIASAYEAAVTLLHTPEFPARIHLVCHLVRDIYTLLPLALGHDAKKSRPSDIYGQLVGRLREQWKLSNLVNEEVPRGSDRVVPSGVFAALDRLMEKSIELEGQPSYGTRLARALFHSMDRPVGSSIAGWIFVSFDNEYKFFVKRAHLALSEQSDDGLVEHFTDFERAFRSLVGSYFAGKEDLDAILQDTNRPAD